MMIGILILGVMECIHAVFSPFKSKATSQQELALIFNLQALFAFSLYSSNSATVNTLISIAMIQFIIFILYKRIAKFSHIISYTKLTFVKCFDLMHYKLSTTQQGTRNFIQLEVLIRQN